MVDGKEGRYSCSRIVYYKRKEYAYLLNPTDPNDQFWYDPITQTKTNLPDNISQYGKK